MKKLLIISAAIVFLTNTSSFSDENNEGGLFQKMKNATCDGFFFGIKAGKNCDKIKNSSSQKKVKAQDIEIEQPAINRTAMEKLRKATCEGFFFGIRAGKNCEEIVGADKIKKSDEKKIKRQASTRNTLNENFSSKDISLYTGTFDVIDKEGDDQTNLFGIEHKNSNLFRNTPLGKFSPITGGFVTGDSSIYLYTGIEGQYSVGPVRILPSFAPGYYEKGDGKDLGNILEFKSEIKVALDIFEDSKLGYSYSHISNNDWGDRNPGTDNQQITFSKNF